MRSSLLSLFAGLSCVIHAGAAPAPPPGPSPEALRLVEARRKALSAFESVDLQRLTPEQQAETLRKIEPALKDFAAALTSKDAHVFSEAVRDLMNGNYRGFPKDRILALLLPRVKRPETIMERMTSQGFIMEHLARWYGPAARAALPDLLALVTDDTVNTYLRGQAIDAAARIAPGDEMVVKAFIVALNNPNPRSTSGVHDRAAAQLGEMGKAAAPARPALEKLLTRGDWYQDPAFLALGKIGRDETPRPLAEYLARLGKLDSIPVEQSAAAFLHIVAAGKTGRKLFVKSTGRVEEVIDAEVVKAVQPVLLGIVEDRKNDVHWRAALRALNELGPGTSPRAARVLSQALLRGGSWPAIEALQRMEPTDAEAAKPLAEAFAQAAKDHDWHTPTVLAGLLTRYGKAARPAVPAVLESLRTFRASPNPGDAYAEQFAAYLAVLSAAGGDEPGVRRLVLDLLNPASDILKRSGPDATPDYQVSLLRTLAQLGLPADGKERKLALVRVREGLASDLTMVFSAAAGVVIAVQPLAQDEAGPLVPLLARVLAPGFRFKAAHARVAARLGEQYPFEQALLFGQRMALRALGALGTQARDVLPAVKALAERPLEKRTSDYRPEPAINAVIRAARKAAEAIR